MQFAKSLLPDRLANPTTKAPSMVSKAVNVSKPRRSLIARRAVVKLWKKSSIATTPSADGDSFTIGVGISKDAKDLDIDLDQSQDVSVDAGVVDIGPLARMLYTADAESLEKAVEDFLKPKKKTFLKAVKQAHKQMKAHVAVNIKSIASKCKNLLPKRRNASKATAKEISYPKENQYGPMFQPLSYHVEPSALVGVNLFENPFGAPFAMTDYKIIKVSFATENNYKVFSAEEEVITQSVILESLVAFFFVTFLCISTFSFCERTVANCLLGIYLPLLFVMWLTTPQ